MKICFRLRHILPLLWGALLIFLSDFLVAQEKLPIVIPPSPTSVQFQRYGEHPVSHFTGVPDITIPIFTIQEGDITVPITMSYHASGFRRHEPDGHVGMGWTLNTGGMITKQIRGLADELVQMDVPDADDAFILPNRPGVSDYPYLNNLYHKSGGGSVDVDHEIDLYSYNFLGHSGRYLIDPNNGYEKVFLEATDLKLSEIDGFQDTNGINYRFGGSGIETQMVEVEGARYQTSTTLHLSSILSSKYPGRGVSYQYQSGKIFSIYNTTNTGNYQYIWDYEINCAGYLYPPEELMYAAFSNNNHRNLTLARNIPYSKYTTKFPSRINFSSGYITFQLSNQQLTRIDIRNYHGVLIKRITFEYGTFYISETGSKAKLQAMVFRDANNSEVERYTFSYYDESATIPGKGTDHWGFYNGYTHDGVVPFVEDVTKTFWTSNGYVTYVDCSLYPNLHVGGYAYKEPNFFAARTYTLSKITYPTGGFTEFEYEAHQNHVGQIAGGLRIKKIKNHESSGVMSTQKEYSYQGAYQEVIPSYDLYRKDEDVYGLALYRRLYLNPQLPINPAPHGASMVYGLVTEMEGSHRTQYQYKIAPAYEYKWLTEPAGNTDYDRIFAHNYRPWNYGYLMSKNILVDGIQVYREATSYNEFETGITHDLVIERAAAVHPGYSSENTMYSIYGTEFFNYANRYHPIGGKRMVSRRIIKDGVEMSLGLFFYENPEYSLTATKSRMITSGLDTIYNEMKYPFDYGSAPYTEMVSDNRLEVIENERSLNSIGTFLDASRTEMKDWGGDVIAPEVIRSKSGDVNAPYEDEVRYHSYDEFGGVKGVSLAHGPRESYLWAYNKLYPVIKGINVTDEQLTSACDSALVDLGHNGGWEDQGEYFLSLIGNLQNTASKAMLQSFVTSLRNYLPPGGQVSVYTYIPLVGMTSATDAKGTAVYYEYDSFYRLKSIRDNDGSILNTYKYHTR